MKNRDIFDKMTQALRNNSIQNMKDDSASNFVTDILSEILSNPEESKSASVTFMRNFKKKWDSSNRTEAIFLSKHVAWLEKDAALIPASVLPDAHDAGK